MYERVFKGKCLKEFKTGFLQNNNISIYVVRNCFPYDHPPSLCKWNNTTCTQYI